MTTYEGEAAPGTMVPAGDLAAAEEAFRKVIADYPRTDQADMARLYLARIALGRNQVDDASAALVELVKRHEGDVIGRLANLDLIHLRIEAGQAVEVAAELEAMAAGQAKGLPRDAALHELGELYIREKQPEKARAYFETLLDEFPESPYVVGARRRLDELG